MSHSEKLQKTIVIVGEHSPELVEKFSDPGLKLLFVPSCQAYMEMLLDETADKPNAVLIYHPTPEEGTTLVDLVELLKDHRIPVLVQTGTPTAQASFEGPALRRCGAIYLGPENGLMLQINKAIRQAPRGLAS